MGKDDNLNISSDFQLTKSISDMSKYFFNFEDNTRSDTSSAYDFDDRNCSIIELNDLMNQLRKTGSKIQDSVLKIKDKREKFERRARIVSAVCENQSKYIFL